MDSSDCVLQSDKTHLDHLVVYNLLKQVHFLDRVPLELISHYLANVTQSTYKTEKVSILIESAHRGDHCLIGLLERGLKRRYFGKNELYVLKKKFQSTLEQFFTRFKRFELLQIRSGLLKADWEPFSTLIIEVISASNAIPTEIKRCDLCLPSCTAEEIRLVETLSATTIEELSLSCMTPETCDLSKRLWAAVTTCHNLRSFEFRPQRRPKIPHSCNEFANVHFRTCLQSLPLEQFRFRGDARFVDESFLLETFGANTNLKQLFITHSCPTRAFAGDSVLPIISRLQTLGLYFHSSKLPQNEAVELAKILRALPESSRLAVSQFVDFDFRPPIRKNIKGAANSMRFWLRLSEQTSRPIHLSLKYSEEMEPVGTTEKAIKSLTRSQPIIDNLIVERKREIVLRRNCAVVVVKILINSSSN
uniref:Uncharacterized protein n=1 Tax=Plectus sambesii TaxID=2011161 RepID=A0A914V809_9BILA